MRQGSDKHLLKGREKWDVGGVMLTAEAVPCLGESQADPLDFSTVFGNTRPVELEIGTGKGTFLLARAKARPEVNFVGIEWARAYALYCADRFRRAALANVRMIHGDASHIVKNCLADSSLSRLHVYFPDPWPKRKHHRRRLIQSGFLEEARRVLRLGGLLLLVTDHRDYFRQIQSVLSAAHGFATVPWPEMADDSGEIVGTNFERKYIAQGRVFYKAARIRYA